MLATDLPDIILLVVKASQNHYLAYYPSNHAMRSLYRYHQFPE
ncbi:MAG: hypothetical protein V7K14_06435 [Nostoc sp.]